MKHLLQNALRSLGYVLVRNENFIEPTGLYSSDGLSSQHNHSFMHEPSFQRAYQRGLDAANGCDPQHHWRVHVALWSAHLALAAEGDFVECGVNAGFMSSSIMTALEWNGLGRWFFLVDSFSGPPLTQFSAAEVANGLQASALDALGRGAYVTDLQRVRDNFAQWPSAIVVPGLVPEILDRVDTRQVAFLHLDMNAASPELAALRHFWPMLPRGGVVLMDDYAFVGYEEQKKAIDALGGELGFASLSLPTGQGLIVKA